MSEHDAADTVELDAVVYRPGYNRKGVAFADDTIRRIAATGSKRPILFHHDPRQEEGVVNSVSVDDDGALIANLTFDDTRALASLRRGVEPRFSIRPQPEDGGTLVCLECGLDQLSGGCIHPWKGGGIEARGPWELAEISRTPTPAVPGTGVRAFLTELAEADVVDPGVRRQWEVAMSDEKIGRADEAPAVALTEADDTSAEVVNLADREKMTAMAAEIADLREGLQLERARRLAVESREVVLAHMRRGALQCEEQAAIELRSQDPVLFDAIVELVPNNPAFSAGTRMTPPAGQVPDQRIAPDDYTKLANECLRIARETGREYEDVFTELRNKQLRGEVG